MIRLLLDHGPRLSTVEFLRGAGWDVISKIEAANQFMPEFIAGHNEKFAKTPRNAHQEIRKDEDLDLIFNWRELRKLTQNLTLHYERKL